MIAIYARQSVDKKDSISIETQIETCRRKVPITSVEPIEVFYDKGFSGKSTVNRPEFNRMMDKVTRGQVSQIVVYKIDRISRSLLDFLNMRNDFAKHNVEFISCAEDFDTSTATGKLMLNMLMMFAEMEREAIQKRIKDNYYSRGEKGLYLGGFAPYGYKKIETHVNGKKTYTFEESTEESEILRKIYNDYINGNSLGDIARYLNDNGIYTKWGRPWINNGVARMLRNPTYVKANAEVYNYLVSLGATMNNEIDDYIGVNGCMVYGDSSKRTGAKFTNLSSDFVTLGLHEGIIDASLWLGVQYIFGQKKGHSNLGTGSLSWLQGLVKCKCGYTHYVKRTKGKHKDFLYFYCRGRRNGVCTYPRDMVAVDKIEEAVEAELLSYLRQLSSVQSKAVEPDTLEINTLKIQVAKIDSDIEKLIKQVVESTDITAQYLNQAVDKLHMEKKKVIDKISTLQLKYNKVNETNIDTDDVIENWSGYNIEKRKDIAKQIIEKIILEGDKLDIIFY